MTDSTCEVSVIVCHHKGDFINGFLDSIHASVTNFPFEIIVVSSDEKFDISKILPIEGNLISVSSIYSEELPATKRNLGALHAQGKYLAFFDDDVEVDYSCLAWFHDSMENSRDKGVRMGYGKLHNAEFTTRFDEAGSFLTWTGFLWSRAEQNIEDKGQFDTEEYILAGKSASCIVDKNVFYQVGGFDKDFGILGEETDLSWRIWLRGYSVIFVPQARGVHYFNTKFKPSTTFYTAKRVFYNGCRNYITMLMKNLGTVRFLTILPVHVTIWFLAGVAKLLTGKVEDGRNIFLGLWYVLSHFSYVMRKRNIVQSTRVQKEKDLIPIIMKSPKPSYYFYRFCRYIKGSVHG